MLEEALKELQMRHAKLNSVKRPVQESDVVFVTSTVFLVDSEENRKKENVPQKNVFDLSDPNFRREVKDALAGKKLGERVSVEFVVDPLHQDKSLAGKKIHYDIMIDQIQERILPGMTREFYKQALGVGVDSEEAFKEELRKQILHRLDAECIDRAVLSAIDQVVEKAELEVPNTLLKRQMEYQKQQDDEMSKQRFDLSLEEYLRKASISLDHYEQEIRERSINVIRKTLVLEEIRKKFDIELDRSDLENEIMRMANVYRTKPENIKAAYYKNQDQLHRLTNELRYLKIAKFIHGKIKIRDVDKLTAKTPQVTEIPSPERGE
jgi:trigger factor